VRQDGRCTKDRRVGVGCSGKPRLPREALLAHMLLSSFTEVMP
jgi:hypothetical protein